MHHDNYHSHNYIVPPLINFLLDYVTLIHYGLVSQKCTCWWYRWQHSLDVRISWWFSERLRYCGDFALCGVPWTAPLSLDWRVLGRTTMVRGAAHYTSPHTTALLAGVEGRIRREDSLGGCPSCGLWGFEANLPAAWRCTYWQCSEYVSLGGSIHHKLGTT